jgi:transposase
MCRTHESNKKYIVRLSAQERSQLKKLVSTGNAAAHRITRARILMVADEGPEGPAWIDEDVAQAGDVTVRTVENIRKRFVNEGLEAAVNRKRQVRPSRARLLDGRQEAKLVALCCSAPPEGRSRWTLRLLADQIVALEIVDSISHETVRQTLKKTS